MVPYRLAEQDFCFSQPIEELERWEIKAKATHQADPFVLYSLPEDESPKLICRTEGWVGDATRLVEVYDTSVGILLKVEGCGEFFIALHGEAICKRDPEGDLTRLEREVILGPALVLALALRGIWSLHASAAMFQGQTAVFLGESGQGKSTLAAYLSNSPGWRLVADDILPVKIDAGSVDVLPRFPQLKLSREAQPGAGLPEHLPLNKTVALTPAGPDAVPELHLLPPSLAIQMLLRHTAGTRMFAPEMLGRHLSFCSLAAGQVPVYRLSYPHRKDALPRIKELLESLC